MLPMRLTSKCVVLKQLYSCFLNDAQQNFLSKRENITVYTNVLIRCL